MKLLAAEAVNGEKEMDRSTCYYFNRSADTPFGYGITERLQVVVAAVLNGILALVVNNIRALLGLFVAVAAYFYQGFYYPFKRVYLIVPHDQLAGIFHIRQYVCFFPFYRTGIILHQRHAAKVGIWLFF